MNKIIYNGNNFFIIKRDRVEFWGMNIENPFGVIINDEIKNLQLKMIFQLMKYVNFLMKKIMNYTNYV